MSSGGWVSTKSRGRDDAQIQQDAAKAKIDRKNAARIKRGLAPLKEHPAPAAAAEDLDSSFEFVGTPKNATLAASKKKRSTRYEDDDDYSDDEVKYRGRRSTKRDEEEDDFIADDDDEDEEDDFDSDDLPDDDEDEDSFNEDEDDTEAEKELEDALPSDDDDSNEDEEDVSFLGKTGASARKSRPSKVFRENAEKMNNVRRSSLDMQKHHTDQARKRRRKSTESLQSLSDTMPSKKTKARPKSRHMLQAVAKRESLGDSDDDDVEIIDSPDPFTPKHHRRQRAQEEEDDNEEYYGDILDDDASPEAIPKLDPSSSSHFGTQVHRNEEAETPTPVPRNRAKSHRPENFGFKEDDDSDDGDTGNKMMTTKVSEQSIPNHFSKDSVHELDDSDNDDSDDEDIRIAKKLSLKSLNKKKAKGHGKWSSKTRMDTGGEENPLELSDESSDDDEDARDDEYVTKEQKAALEILKTAEQLSAQVCTVMRGWTTQTDEGTSEKALQGIITDGAITLGKIDGAAIRGSSQFITGETMRKVCPKVKLADYQLVGVNWMLLLDGMSCEVGTRGNTKVTNVNGVLADEMGLGKTVQTIVFLAFLKYQASLKQALEDESLPHLIVVPVSVLKNWMNEFEKFCPDMYVECYHGSMEEREALRNRLEQHLPKHRKHSQPSKHLDCLIAPSTYFSKESSDDRRFLSQFRFSYLVVDEAHILKSSKSMRYQQLQKIKSEHRLLLTGTPVQNNPRELLNMLSFLMPLFSRPGGLGSGEDTSIVDDLLEYFVDEKKGTCGNDSKAYRKLKQLFAPFVLRRKKDDVLSQMLPQKRREVRMVDLDPAARKMYDSIIRSHVEKNGSKVSAAIGEHLFTNLRKAAHHPLLLRNRHTTTEEIDHLANVFLKHGAFQGEAATVEKVKVELTRWNDFNIHAMAHDLICERSSRSADLERYILHEDALFESAKFKELKILIPDLIAKGHRILIFSSWTSCLDLLECLMNNLDLKFCRMDGSTPGEERQQMIDVFNRDESFKIFLLSTKACGLGINLTAADTCIMHDLDFNPFNDLQAEDRCHRIGQKKTVTVYKLVTRNTVDEDVYNMQDKKVAMNAAIMESTSAAEERKIKQELLRRQIGRICAEAPAQATDNGNGTSNVIVID